MQEGLWQAVLGEIELSVSHASFVTWFKNTCVLKNDNEIITIGVPNVFIKQQLESKYNQLIVDVLNKNGASSRKVEFKIHTSAKPINLVEENEILKTPASTTTEKSKHGPSSLTHTYRQGLNERYTFENFIVGS